VLSRILGGKTFSSQVLEFIKELPEIEPIFLFFDDEDYSNPNIPRIYRLLKFVAPRAIRQKYDDRLIDPTFDAVFIQSFELILFFGDIIRNKPTILAHDSTDILGHWMVLNESPGLINKLKFKFKNMLTMPLYKRVVEHIDFFLPRTSWCAASLINDYCIPANHIIVTPSGLDLKQWKPKERKHNEKPKLLFVGNDFERKGGYFLLKFYADFLSELSKLVIVSNDQRLAQINLPSGVDLVKGISHEKLERLIEIYRDADIFVFPTRNDRLGLVLLEAAATGLPLVATDIGGISDVVKNGVNGYLMPYQSTGKDWADRIIDLIINGNKLLKFGKESRQLAEKQFSSDVFKNNILKAFKIVGNIHVPHPFT
jgi:glycosyltransferase involved in cell wall biosynthesis